MAEGGDDFNSDISIDETSYISEAKSPEQQILSSNTEPIKFPRQELSPPDNSLEIETGVGNFPVFYPPTFRNRSQVLDPNPRQLNSVNSKDGLAIFQTSRTRRASESSESLSPHEANTPCGSPCNIHIHELVTSGTNKPTYTQRPNRGTIVEDSRNLDNSEGPVIIVHERNTVLGEPAVFDNVLTKPNMPGYENISSALVDYQNMSQKEPVKHPSYKDERIRLHSFQRYRWPHYLPSPRRLAASNLFFNGMVQHADGTVDIDIVVCYRCGGTLCKFKPTDDPGVEHRTWYPRCYKTNWEC